MRGNPDTYFAGVSGEIGWQMCCSSEDKGEGARPKACRQMKALMDGQEATPNQEKKSEAPAAGLQALGDPELWTVVRKLCLHPEFRARVVALSEKFEDTSP